MYGLDLTKDATPNLQPTHQTQGFIEGTIVRQGGKAVLKADSAMLKSKNTSGGVDVQISFTLHTQTIFGGSVSVNINPDNNKEVIITNGDLGAGTYVKLRNILDNNPQIDTVVLHKVDGSVDDTINVETGRMIRNREPNTKVLSDSDISSGGVDLFASGVKRIYTRGATIGVHSWNGPEGEGKDYSKNDKVHYSQLGYFTAMLPHTGYDFYFYTLNSASAEGIYHMRKEEVLKYKLATDFID